MHQYHFTHYRCGMGDEEEELGRGSMCGDDEV